MKNIKLYEEFLNEGTAQITNPIILAAIRAESRIDFQDVALRMQGEAEMYRQDLLDALHKLDLPLNPDTVSLSTVYEKVMKLQKPE
jgi:thiazole synthase ThiGH ThiG subunit